MKKSLTFSGYKLQGRTKINGLDISIENKKGSVRSGTDKDGREWKTKMHYPYGYIKGTIGKDKQHLDAYIGNNKNSDVVYIVHQNDPVSRQYDEDKVMVGFNSADEAKKAYMNQYDRPGFFGSMTEMGMDEFKEKIFSDKWKGSMIKSLGGDRMGVLLANKNDGSLILIKGKKMPIGTVSKGRKKVKEGLWIPIKKEKIGKQVEKETISADIKDGKLKVKKKDFIPLKKDINVVTRSGKSVIIRKNDKIKITKKGDKFVQFITDKDSEPVRMNKKEFINSIKSKEVNLKKKTKDYKKGDSVEISFEPGLIDKGVVIKNNNDGTLKVKWEDGSIINKVEIKDLNNGLKEENKTKQEMDAYDKEIKEMESNVVNAAKIWPEASKKSIANFQKQQREAIQQIKEKQKILFESKKKLSKQDEKNIVDEFVLFSGLEPHEADQDTIDKYLKKELSKEFDKDKVKDFLYNYKQEEVIKKEQRHGRSE